VLAQLRSRAPDASVEALLGQLARPEDIRLRVSGDVKLFKPDGKPLLVLRKAAISEAAASAAYDALHALRDQVTRNRGAFSGMEKKNYVRKDGVESHTNQTGPVPSFVIGNMDRYPRMPFCRQCALTLKHPEEWASCLPLIQEVARLFEREMPERYKAQHDVACKTHPA
jgi:hypothetical protein